MSARRVRLEGLVELAVSAGLALVCAYVSVRMMRKMMHPIPEAHKVAKKKLCQELGIAESKLRLDEYEMAMLQKVMLPHQVGHSLRDVAGADRILDKLKQDIKFSCAIRPTGSDSMLTGSKGLLLYGPPGTGKTMIASAFASEIGAILINIRGSAIFSKWVGDSERLTSAVFSLAAKFAAHGQTVILFIDEVDALLGDRTGSGEHEVSRHVRTEFMQLWDGLLRSERLLVVAATNQPNSLSDAIWRRFSAHFEVPLPDASARAAIISTKLRKVQQELQRQSDAWRSRDFVPKIWFAAHAMTTLEPTTAGMPDMADLCATCSLPEEQVRLVLSRAMPPLRRVAALTHRYSGSDLLEVCKLAARHCVLAELNRPEPAEASSSSSSSFQSAASPPRSPAHATAAATVVPASDADTGTSEKPADHSTNGSFTPAAGPITEAVLIKCISEVKTAANTARRNYARSDPPAQPGGAPGAQSASQLIALLQAVVSMSAASGNPV